MFFKFKANNNSFLNSHVLDKNYKNQLLDYNYYYQKNNDIINKKINKSKFKPHELWINWNKNYFLSISHNRVLDLTSFGSEEDKSYKITNRGKNFNLLNYQLNIQNRGEFFNTSSLKKNSTIILNLIKKFYDNPKKYLKNYLIIGAGNAFEVCKILEKFPKVKFAIIDLPEVINSGYLTIKNFNKKITINLPNEAVKFSQSKSQINYYFPSQTNLIDQSFDIGNNIGSFQEMHIEVINNYFNFIHKKLKKSRFFISINSENSRYIPRNSISNYKISKFKVLISKRIKRYNSTIVLVLKKL